MIWHVNELMQTSCSSFANRVRETVDVSYRINLISPHLKYLGEGV